MRSSIEWSQIVRAMFVFAGRSSEFSRSNLYVHGYVFRRAFEAARSAFPLWDKGVRKTGIKMFTRSCVPLCTLCKRYSGLLFQTERPSSEFYLTNDDGASRWKRQWNEIERGCIVCLGGKYLLLVRPTRVQYISEVSKKIPADTRNQRSLYFKCIFLINNINFPYSWQNKLNIQYRIIAINYYQIAKIKLNDARLLSATINYNIHITRWLARIY